MAGEALTVIRDGKLYRATHATFEDYCQQVWGIERRHGYRLIEAHAICVQLDTPADSLDHGDLDLADLARPLSESVARELTPLRDQPTELEAVWRETIEEHGERPTAAQVREVRQRRQAPEPEAHTDESERLSRVKRKPTKIGREHIAHFQGVLSGGILSSLEHGSDRLLDALLSNSTAWQLNDLLADVLATQRALATFEPKVVEVLAQVREWEQANGTDSEADDDEDEG
jgi:hypothetical protein